MQPQPVLALRLVLVRRFEVAQLLGLVQQFGSMPFVLIQRTNWVLMPMAMQWWQQRCLQTVRR